MFRLFHIDNNKEKPIFEIKLHEESIINEVPLTDPFVDSNDFLQYEQAFIDYFFDIEQIDLSVSPEIMDAQQKNDTTRIAPNRILWHKCLDDYLSGILMENTKVTLLEKLLYIRFLNSCFFLASPYQFKELSINQITEIKIQCHIFRLIFLHQLYNDSLNVITNKGNNAVIAFINEFERFVDFISEHNFNNYFINDSLRLIVNNYFQGSETEIDHLVIKVTELVAEISNLDFVFKTPKLKERINKNISKLINSFYWPRYTTRKETKKLLNFFSIIDNLNSHYPRLLAAILIGLVPVILTGEINEWAFERLALFNADFHLMNINWFNLFILLSITVFSLTFSYLYLMVEVKNVLGYENETFKKRHKNLFFKGLLYSGLVSLLGHLVFTGKFVGTAVDDNNLAIWPSFMEQVMFMELYIVQVCLSFVLGIILQTVWEDKPITQPL